MPGNLSPPLSRTAVRVSRGGGGQRSDIVQRADMRMIQGRYHARFAFEALAELLRGDLDGDGAAKARVQCAVDFAHPAFGKQLNDRVRPKLAPDHRLA